MTVIKTEAWAGSSVGRPERLTSQLPLFACIAGSTLSSAIFSLLPAALPWLILSKAGEAGAAEAGLAFVFVQAPGALGASFGGILMQTYGARRTILAADGLQLAFLALAAMLALTSSGVPYLALAFCLGCASATATPGDAIRDASLPAIARLAKVGIGRANGARELFDIFGQAGGPAIAILLVSSTGIANTLLFCLALRCITWLVDLAAFPPLFRPKTGAKPASFSSSLRFITGSPFLRTLVAVSIGVVGLYAALSEVIAPAMVLARGGAPSEVAGFLGLAGGAAVCGTVAFAALAGTFGLRTYFLAGLWIFAAGYEAVARSHSLAPFWLGPVLCGLAAGLMAPAAITALQKAIPQAIRGPALGAFGAIVILFSPVTVFVTGVLVSHLGALRVANILAVFALAAVSAIAATGVLRDMGGTPPRPA